MEAKAGDGLPSFERKFIKYILVPSVRTLMTWRMALFLIQRERKLIEKITSGLNEEQLKKRVKINRVFAIEEHSSDFSINMVLEHLYIAGNAVFMVIEFLSQEKEFKRDIKIEGVKPKGEDIKARANFLEFMNKYENYIKEHKKKESKTTKAHPWFMNFNNGDWVRFMYMHTFIHRRQIQEIKRVIGTKDEQL